MACTENPVDQTVCVRPAGIPSSRNDGNVASCLFHEVTEHEAQTFPSKSIIADYKLPPPKTNIYKGVFTDVRECLRPDTDQGLYSLLKKEFEDTVYASYWKKPLGRVADQTPMLPAGMDSEKVCFGKVTPKDISAGELINPSKEYDQIIDARAVHDLYKKTHNNYEPGEQIKRNYGTPFNKDLVWGKSTPCDPRGRCMKKVMEVDSNKNLVPTILADHHKRTQPLVGKVLAPNKNEDCVPAGHAFGRVSKKELFGVRELMNDCIPTLDKHDLYEQLAHINSIRQQIAKRPLFPHRDFIDAFHKIDIDNIGCLPLEKAYSILSSFHIFPEKRLFEGLMRRLNILSKNEMVSYDTMADTLNVNVLLPDIPKVEDVPSDCLNFETTNQIAQKYHCSDKPFTKTEPTAGLPPKKHMSVELLVSPSIFFNYGLQPKDFFVSRSPDYLRTLFARVAGCDLDSDVFNKVWDAAKDNNGIVSVHSFLEALKQTNNTNSTGTN